MSDKLNEVLEKSIEELNKLKKGFEGFGTAIGGGTTENPTIKPTTETSQEVRDNTSGGGIGSWFGMSEKKDDDKEKVDYFKNGQWEITKACEKD